MVVAAALCCTLIAWATVLFPIGQDQATFAYVARIWENGGLPFRDALDTKPVGIYALYVAADLIFGRSIAAFRLFEMVLAALSILAFQSIFRSFGYARPRRAAFLAWVLMVAFYFMGQEFWARGQAEFPIGLLALWLVAVLAACGRRSLLTHKDALQSGFLVGCAVLLKQNYIVLSAGFLYVVYAIGARAEPPGRYRLSRIALYSAGGALPFLIVLIYFAARGALREFLHGMFVLPYQYAKGAQVPGQSLLSYGSTVLYNLLFVAAGCYALFAWVRERHRAPKVALTVLAAVLFGLAVQRKFWTYHMLSLLPVLAVLITDGLIRFAERIPLPKQAAWAILATGCLVHVGLLAAPLYGPSYTSRIPLPRKLPVGSSYYAGAVRNSLLFASGQIKKDEYYATFEDSYLNSVVDYRLGMRLHQLARHGETIQLFEFRPPVYIYADRFAPHRFFFASLVLLVRGKERARLETEFVRLTYTTRRPDWIVFGLDGPWLGEAVGRFSPARHGYRLVEDFESPYHANGPLKRVRLGIFRDERARR